uniref:CCHC-type domain-containing protein n=1 Tax=Schizophyllum commune (strain H4-8 / FGSC 9210) TaxID=578458 RepID=D8QM44_SCHCM
MSSLPSYAVTIFQQSEKLRGEANWHSFAEAFIDFCTGVGADHIVDDSSLDSSKKALDNAIGYVLSGMLEKDVKDGVPGKRGGQALYKALKAKYTASTRARRVAARKAFYQCSHDFPTQSLEQFIVEVRAKAQVLKDMGITISDTEILDVILMNVHHAFIATTTILLAQTTEPKLDDAISTLTSSPALNVDVVKKEEYSPSPLLAANAARGSRAPRHPDGHQADLTGGWVDDKGYRWCNVNGDACHRCGRAGHIAAFCMYNMPEAIRQKISDRAHLNANMVSSLAVMEAEGEHQHLAQSAYALSLTVICGLLFVSAPSHLNTDGGGGRALGGVGSWPTVARRRRLGKCRVALIVARPPPAIAPTRAPHCRDTCPHRSPSRRLGPPRHLRLALEYFPTLPRRVAARRTTRLVARAIAGSNACALANAETRDPSLESLPQRRPSSCAFPANAGHARALVGCADAVDARLRRVRAHTSAQARNRQMPERAGGPRAPSPLPRASSRRAGACYYSMTGMPACMPITAHAHGHHERHGAAEARATTAVGALEYGVWASGAWGVDRDRGAVQRAVAMEAAEKRRGELDASQPRPQRSTGSTMEMVVVEGKDGYRLRTEFTSRGTCLGKC